MRTIFTVGTEFEVLRVFARLAITHGGFLEFTALDHYLFIWARNAGALSFAFPWSLGFGYRARF